ncbi:hypothetical protein ACVNS2_03480 [Paenibacillus caseinilyticus]|uniref:Uncharacterized protein n=1 Tax=Paenibacillus mucilaginosus K02 TaxID=997761 RepID=I0BBJ4_9BACL|nr:hypothetical protein [Paenibacillus mucilaginosus]AFH59741.1 hypothetical protein B2K_03195 [Paenibacillus mucilaginosus K02]
MILYQMAKRLAERSRLKSTIERSEGSVADELRTQKDQVEEQLMSQASIWTEEGQDEFMLTELPPEGEWNDMQQAWT